MRLVLVGPPGAGKGTQAAFIADAFSVPAISTGDLFRHHVANKTPLGVKVKEYMNAGDLVPDEITVQMLLERLDEQDAENGFLLDGFPRNLAQAHVLDEILIQRDTVLDRVLELRVDTDEVVRRISGRRTCHTCGKIWHVEYDPTEVENVCDRCGGELYQREDDQSEAVRNRLSVYEEQTAPLTGYYGAQGKLVHIDAEGPVEDVTARALKALAT